MLFLVSSLSGVTPLIRVGDDVDVVLDGNTTVRYTTNLFNDENNRQDDYLLKVSPGIEAMIGTDTPEDILRLLFREDFYFHLRNSAQDRAQAHFLTKLSYGETRTSFTTLFAFDQQAQNSPEANLGGDLLKINSYRFNIEGDYELTPKTIAEMMFDLEAIDYKHQDFNDHNVYALSGNLYYQYSPKIEIGPGYRFRYTDIGGGNDMDDYFINLSIRGEVAHKVDASFHIGGQHRNAKRRSDRTTFSVISRMRWDATKKVDVIGNFEKDFDVGATNDSIEHTGGELKISYFCSHCLSSYIGFGYNEADYQYNPDTRKDKTTKASFNVSYHPNIMVTAVAEYSYVNNNSTQLGSSYKTHTINLTARIRY